MIVAKFCLLALKVLLVAIIISVLFTPFHTVFQTCSVNEITTSEKGRTRFLQSPLLPFTEEGSDAIAKQLDKIKVDIARTLKLYTEASAAYRRLFREEKQNGVVMQFSTGNTEEIKCSDEPFLLIQIHSDPSNFMARESIRLSWGRLSNLINKHSSKRSWKTVFLMGRHEDNIINNLVQREARVNGDIVTGDFLDSFRNLSRKMVLSINWPLHHCRAQFILKTDEDCYVNVPLLIDWLLEHQAINGSKPLYAGNLRVRSEVIREYEQRYDPKYYVSTEEYPEKFYPDYISGGGYVFSWRLLPELSRVSKKIPLIPIEDACLGLLMRSIGVKPIGDSRFLPYIWCEQEWGGLQELPLCHFLGPFVIHGIEKKMQITMHYNVRIMTHVPTICSYLKNQRASEKHTC